jgi:nucleoside-diphosphate-sugar epimerase
MTVTLRIFLAGASGVLGQRLVPLLVVRGHVVAGMTRSPNRADQLRALGAEPIVCDVYDADALRAAVVKFAPDVVMHQLTDLPDSAADLDAAASRANARIRREGTRNLLGAYDATDAHLFVAQSIAWSPGGDGQRAGEELEEMTLAVDGVVIRYGQFYGPGTFYEGDPPDPPRVHIDDAARRTLDALEARATTLTVAE